MTWKPIVVGIDASRAAVEAAAFAVRVAQRAKTTCHAVHAAGDALIPWHETADRRYRLALIDQARAQLVTGLRGGVPAEVLGGLTVRLGNAPRVLIDVASEVNGGLIVVGGKDHSALDRWLGGSTSLNVARITDVPLLVTAGPGRMIRRVLAAVDVSSAAAPTLDVAQQYATLFGAELRAVSVLEPLPVIPEVTPPYDVSQYYALSEELLQREVWPLVQASGAQTVVRYGPAVETILGETAEWNADLLIVGSHGKGWAERMLVGSVTERLLNHLPTSVLVVPTRAARALVSEQRSDMERSRTTVAIA
jgi:nucleotide-binding universal stress UspA family protein